MNTIATIGLTAAFLVGSAGAAAVFIHNSAKHEQQFTRVKEGTIKFLMYGNDLAEVIVNVDGKQLAPEDGVPGGRIVPIEFKKERIRRHWPPEDYLKDHWGIHFVSLAYPARSVHRFPIIKARLTTKAVADSESTVIGRIEVDPEPVMVSELWESFYRPFAVISAETKDNLHINLLVMGSFRVEIPYIPVFTFRGDFFSLIEFAVNSAVTDYALGKTYDELLKEPKGKDSGLFKALMAINENATVGTTTGGLVKGLGIRVTGFTVEGFEMSKEDKLALDAKAKLQIAKDEGKAKVEQARLDARAAEHRAKAATAETRKLIEALETAQQNGTLGAVRDIRVSENLGGKDSNLQYLSLGGGNLLPSLNIGDLGRNQHGPSGGEPHPDGGEQRPQDNPRYRGRGPGKRPPGSNRGNYRPSQPERRQPENPDYPPMDE